MKLVRSTPSGRQILVIPNHSLLDTGTIRGVVRQAANYLTDEKIPNFLHRVIFDTVAVALLDQGLLTTHTAFRQSSPNGLIIRPRAQKSRVPKCRPPVIVLSQEGLFSKPISRVRNRCGNSRMTRPRQTQNLRLNR